jgi:hypothetical protein
MVRIAPRLSNNHSLSFENDVIEIECLHEMTLTTSTAYHKNELEDENICFYKSIFNIIVVSLPVGQHNIY